MPRDQRFEGARIRQAAPDRRALAMRRMMQHDDARQFSRTRLFEKPREGVALRGAEPTGGDKRRRRHARGQADQSHLATHAQIRKRGQPVFVARRPCRKGAREMRQRRRHIGVVIARREAHVAGRAQALHHRPRQHEFIGQPDVREIAGHGDMIGPLRWNVGDQRVEHAHVVDAGAAALPVDPAGQPLAREIARARPRQGAEMQVGQMGEQEGHVWLLPSFDAPRKARARFMPRR